MSKDQKKSQKNKPKPSSKPSASKVVTKQVPPKNDKKIMPKAKSPLPAAKPSIKPTATKNSPIKTQPKVETKIEKNPGKQVTSSKPTPLKAEVKKPEMKKVEIKKPEIKKQEAKKPEPKQVAITNSTKNAQGSKQQPSSTKPVDKKQPSIAAATALKVAATKPAQGTKTASSKTSQASSAPADSSKGGKKKGKVLSEEEEFFLQELEARKKIDHEDEDDEEEKEAKKNKAKTTESFKERFVEEDQEPVIAQKIIEFKDFFDWNEIEPQIQSFELFMPKDDACLERGCENMRTTMAYCRFHYINNWKNIQKKRELLKDKKLQFVVEDIASKFTVPCLQSLLEALGDDREFNRLLVELNISDHEFEVEEGEAIEDSGDDDLEFEARSLDTFKPGFEEE